MIFVEHAFHEPHTKNTTNTVLLCFSYGVAFSSISRMVSASAAYMNTALQLSQVACQFQFSALLALCPTDLEVT
jgi:hypothetical protein